MSDIIEPTDPIEPESTADAPPALEQVEPDVFAAMISDLGDVAAAAAAVEAEHAQEASGQCEESVVIVESEYAPRHLAWSEVASHLEDAMEVADCLMEIDTGSDCDHVLSGVECPVSAMDEKAREAAAHFMACPGCLAAHAVDVVWEYAVVQEVTDVVRHLMAQRVRAESDGEHDVVLMLSEIIDNVTNGHHRSA